MASSFDDRARAAEAAMAGTVVSRSYLTRAFEQLMKHTMTVPVSAVHPDVLADLLCSEDERRREAHSADRPQFETFPDPGFHQFGN